MRNFVIGFTLLVVVSVVLYLFSGPGAEPTPKEVVDLEYAAYLAQLDEEKKAEWESERNEEDAQVFETKKTAVLETTDNESITISVNKETTNDSSLSQTVVVESTKEELPMGVDELGRHLVYYTDDGFLPDSVTVDLRDTARFINKSSRPMWVRVLEKDLQVGRRTKDDYYSVYASFDQGSSVPNGGEFLYDFISPGNWKYENVAYPAHQADVLVVE